MTTYYIFHSTAETQVAITDDRTGARLPKPEFGYWEQMKSVSIKPGGGPLIRADSDDVIAGVSRNGYYLWPQPKKHMPTGPKSEKRAADWIGAAVKVMRIATGEEPEDQGPETEKKEEARQEHDA